MSYVVGFYHQSFDDGQMIDFSLLVQQHGHDNVYEMEMGKVYINLKPKLKYCLFAASKQPTQNGPYPNFFIDSLKLHFDFHEFCPFFSQNDT